MIGTKGSRNRYAESLNPLSTPQSLPIPGREPDMAKNRAGGFTFSLDKWARLRRFLILGTEGSTYYASEQEMTVENVGVLKECVNENGMRVLKEITELDMDNRVPKRSTLVFALSYISCFADEDTKSYTSKVLPSILRTASDLFQYLSAVKSMRGKLSGRTVRSAIANWYNSKTPRDLAYQMAKYQQRYGFTHRDALRLGHPKPVSDMHNQLMRATIDDTVLDKANFISLIEEEYAQPLIAARLAKTAHNSKEIVELINQYDLVRECIPTQFLNFPDVWESLLIKMPYTAMVRNLAKMTSVGLLKPLSDTSKIVYERLTSADLINKSRVHPIQLLSALMTYNRGVGYRGSLNWTPLPTISKALEQAFYLSFNAITPTNLNWYVGVDVSGSMTMGEIAGVPGLNPRVASMCLALVTARTESNNYIAAFSDRMYRVNIHSGCSLHEAIRVTNNIPFGRTDCALPMIDARRGKLDVDIFVVLTDNETWCGDIHPSIALDSYRQSSGRDARLIVVGMVSNGYSIADPLKPYMLDIVGFDSSGPSIMSDFALGNI